MQSEFVITNGDKFIRFDINGKCKQVSNVAMAETYPTKKAANNVRLNSITKALTRKFYVAELKDGKIIEHNVPAPPKVCKKKTDIMFHYENNIDDMMWSHGFDGVKELFDSAATRCKELPQELSDVESEITDIEHFIENTKLNVRDGYKIYKKLRDLLDRRRRIKYEIEMVSAINNNRAAVTYLNNIQSAISNCISNKVYKPRILGELFTKGISYLDR